MLKKVCQLKSSLEDDILRFIHEVGRAKNLPRTGWREKAGIKFPESIAEHMYRTAVLSMVLSDLKGLSTERVLKMALLDDLAEITIGDLTPTQKRAYGLERIRKFEQKALEELLSLLPKVLSKKYMAIWKEAQSLRTREARLVKSADKLEMAVQAQEYSLEDYDAKKLKEFITSAGRKIVDRQVEKILTNLKVQPKVISQT